MKTGTQVGSSQGEQDVSQRAAVRQAAGCDSQAIAEAWVQSEAAGGTYMHTRLGEQGA